MEVNTYELTPDPRELSSGRDDCEIYLQMVIGNGQIGGTKVTCSGKTLAKGRLDSPTYLGMASEFSNNKIRVETNVLDMNPATNMCVITTRFQDELNNVLFDRIDKGEAPENGGASFIGKYAVSLLLLLCISLASVTKLKAQTFSNELSFDQLATPTSPGFMLLDQAPSAIERPTTAEGFGAELLGFLQGAGGAVETTPFWLFTHPNLTNQDMYETRFPILHTLSISLGQSGEDSIKYYSSGLRTRVFQVYRSSTKEALKTKQDSIVNALADGAWTLAGEIRNRYQALTEAPILTIDIAAAIAGKTNKASLESLFNDAILSRWGIWTTVNYRPKAKDFYATLLARMLGNPSFSTYDDSSNLYDFGFKLNYDIGRFNLSCEYLGRIQWAAQTETYHRFALVANCLLMNNMYLNASIGKNFVGSNKLIALAGINFGISKDKLKLTK